MSIESVMLSNHLILCHPLLLPSVFPSIRVFFNESALRIRWPKYWSFSFSISPSNGYSGLISFRMDWLDLLAPFTWVLVHKVLFVPSTSLFPILCKFWWLYGGANGDLLQEGLCHSQVYCTQSACGRPLLTCTSSGDTQTQFWLSFCGVPGSLCTQGLFESSEHLRWVWGLILYAILPLLPSCWGFSFAFAHGESPQSHSSAMKPLHQEGPQTLQIQCIQKTKLSSFHLRLASPLVALIS